MLQELNIITDIGHKGFSMARPILTTNSFSIPLDEYVSKEIKNLEDKLSRRYFDNNFHFNNKYNQNKCGLDHTLKVLISEIPDDNNGAYTLNDIIDIKKEAWRLYLDVSAKIKEDINNHWCSKRPPISSRINNLKLEVFDYANTLETL